MESNVKREIYQMRIVKKTWWILLKIMKVIRSFRCSYCCLSSLISYLSLYIHIISFGLSVYIEIRNRNKIKENKQRKETRKFR